MGSLLIVAAARTTRPRPSKDSSLRSSLGDDTAGRHVQGRRLSCDPNVVEMAQYAEYIEQPKDYYHHHHDIEDLLDLPIHGDVGVDEPEQDSDYDEGDDDCY